MLSIDSCCDKVNTYFLPKEANAESYENFLELFLKRNFIFLIAAKKKLWAHINLFNFTGSEGISN